ncbi:response regulator, partial [Bacteroides sp.]
MDMKINPAEYKILVVDDVISNVLLLKVLLTNEKFVVVTANNGREALEQMKAEKPDLVLLDVMMPDMSGFEVATLLKKDPETAEVPIIF